jgi:hypothetical protein
MGKKERMLGKVLPKAAKTSSSSIRVLLRTLGLELDNADFVLFAHSPSMLPIEVLLDQLYQFSGIQW